MELTMTPVQRGELEAAVAAARRPRSWKRYQAVLLLAEGQTPAAVAHALRCHVASVYGWAAAWRRSGTAGLAEGPHLGAARRLNGAGDALLGELLGKDPQACGHQATGWTVPLLRAELIPAGYHLSAHRPPRVAPAGVPLETTAVCLGSPRSGLHRKKGAVIAQAAATVAAGGEVWVADETALREFPPLRAGWSTRGEPARVVISGRNTRRTILGALQVSSGELICTVRERCRTDDVLAAVGALGAIRPEVPKLLI